MSQPSPKLTKDRYIIMPPGLHAIAAIASHDSEEIDGIPLQSRLGGVHCREEGGTFIAEASDGRIAGRYIADMGKVMNGRIFEPGERFPNIESCIPTTPPAVTLRIDPALMIRLLDACERVTNGEPVEIEVRGPTSIVVVRATNEDRGREFIGLIVPCPKPEKT